MILLGFILGMIIGSFLNAWIWRLFVQKSIIHGRSMCPNCKHQLAGKDLVPVLSFVSLKGRCRYCAEKISWQYPVVELTTALALAFLAFKFGMSDVWLWMAVITCLLLVIFVLDLRYSIIPDAVSIPLILVGLLSFWFQDLPWLDILAGGVVGGGFFLLQWVLSRGKWVGDGDIRLGLAMGVLLGWKILVLALFLAYVAGAVCGVCWIISRRKSFGSQIPFGTFLTAATWVSMIWGQRMLDWYLNILQV